MSLHNMDSVCQFRQVAYLEVFRYTASLHDCQDVGQTCCYVSSVWTKGLLLTWRGWEGIQTNVMEKGIGGVDHPSVTKMKINCEQIC